MRRSSRRACPVTRRRWPGRCSVARSSRSRRRPQDRGRHRPGEPGARQQRRPARHRRPRRRRSGRRAARRRPARPGHRRARRVAGAEQLDAIPAVWRAYLLELMTRCWLAHAPRRSEPPLRRPGQRRRGRVALGNRDGLPRSRRGRPGRRRRRDGCTSRRCTRPSSPTRRHAGRGRPGPTIAGRALAELGDRDRAVGELEQAAAELDRCGAVRYRDAAQRATAPAGPSHPSAHPAGEPDQTA